MVRKKNSNTLAENRKARHDYFVEETIEAGLELVGTEVKSIRWRGIHKKYARISIWTRKYI